jgi:hypothetical protein
VRICCSNWPMCKLPSPRLDLATKIAVAVIPDERDKFDLLERWFSDGTDICKDFVIGDKVSSFLRQHKVHTVVIFARTYQAGAAWVAELLQQRGHGLDISVLGSGDEPFPALFDHDLSEYPVPRIRAWRSIRIAVAGDRPINVHDCGLRT